jgi:hypothetical protein
MIHRVPTTTTGVVLPGLNPENLDPYSLFHFPFLTRAKRARDFWAEFPLKELACLIIASDVQYLIDYPDSV